MAEENDPKNHSGSFEVAMEIPLDCLDKKYLGYYVVDNLGYRGPGMPPLLSSNVQINEAVLDVIHSHASHLGEDGEALTHIRVKRKKQTVVPKFRETITPQQRKLIFRGVEATVTAIKKQFKQLVPNSEELIKQGSTAAIEKIRELKLEQDPEFTSGIESVLKEILEKKEEATLISCLGQYDEETYDHGLRVFVIGMKMLSRLFGLTPERMRRNRRAMNYAYGLLYLDIGQLFVPNRILHRHMRIDLDEFLVIGQKFKEKELDSKLFKIIYLINDPQRVFTGPDEKAIIKQIEDMAFLVKEGVLTSDQYEALCSFPSWSSLSKREREIMEHHPIFGYELIKSSSFSSLQALDIIRHHHERLDQSGYPDGLSNMSDEAQVAAVVDTFDAIISERPHKAAKPYDYAFDVIDRLTKSDSARPAKLGRKFYELLCACIQKYPVGSFIKIEGGRYDGYVGQVREYIAGEHTMNRPEFILFRDNEGNRLDHCLIYKRKHYDGSFRIKGLPYTAKCSRDMLSGGL